MKNKLIQRVDPEYLKFSLQLSIRERLEFLENFRLLAFAAQNQDSTHISLRINKNLLELFKLKAGSEGKKYQSKIKELMQDYVLNS